MSDEVTVFVFSDRLEITNSGQMPEKMVLGKSTVLPHGSVLRNPLMAEVLTCHTILHTLKCCPFLSD